MPHYRQCWLSACPSQSISPSEKGASRESGQQSLAMRTHLAKTLLRITVAASLLGAATGRADDAPPPRRRSCPRSQRLPMSASRPPMPKSTP